MSTYFVKEIPADALHDVDELHHDGVKDVVDHGEFQAHHGGEEYGIEIEGTVMLEPPPNRHIHENERHNR